MNVSIRKIFVRRTCLGPRVNCKCIDLRRVRFSTGNFNDVQNGKVMTAHRLLHYHGESTWTNTVDEIIARCFSSLKWNDGKREIMNANEYVVVIAHSGSWMPSICQDDSHLAHAALYYFLFWWTVFQSVFFSSFLWCSQKRQQSQRRQNVWPALSGLASKVKNCWKRWAAHWKVVDAHDPAHEARRLRHLHQKNGPASRHHDAVRKRKRRLPKR